MQSGTILFAGTDLGLYGNPRFTIRKAADPAPPQIATHWRVTITVSVALSAEMPATVWARARKIHSILEAGGRKTLAIKDENGTVLSWEAQPTEFSSLTEALRRKEGTVEISFTALQTINASPDNISAIIDTLDAEPNISIDKIMNWSESVRPSRPDERLGNRTEIAQSINFTARAAFADTALDAAARAAYLIQEKIRFERAAGKEVSLTFAGETRIVQFEAISATPSEGWEYLTIEGQARRVVLPGDLVAEVTFESSASENPATGETLISVSGNVEADTYLIASNKIDAILTAYRTVGTRVISIKKTDRYHDGLDAGNEPTWLGLSFQIELARNTDQTRYTLQITDREGTDGRRVTYSGTAHASTLEILLATVETAAGNKHPVEISSELTISYATDDEGNLKLISGSFSREYALAAQLLRGNVQLTTSKSSLGERIATLTGTIAAPNEAQAVAHARSFIPAGVILKVDSEKTTTHLHNKTPATTAAKAESFGNVEFSYSWGQDHVGVTGITYTDASVPDYTTMQQERTISGKCHAPNKATAINEVNNLITALGLGATLPTRTSLTHSHEREITLAAIDRWHTYEFSYTYQTSITGEVAHDIIRAEWSISRTGQVNHKPMTEVPFTNPVMQGEYGYNIGTLTANGTCVARVQQTARTWGQGKRASLTTGASSSNYAEDPPQERMSKSYLPFKGGDGDATFYEFTFTYSYRFRTGLEGLWPNELTL